MVVATGGSSGGSSGGGVTQTPAAEPGMNIHNVHSHHLPCRRPYNHSVEISHLVLI